MKRICKNKTCKNEFDARPADVNRGWGLYCSKRCKAVAQERRTGQYNDYQNNRARVHDPEDDIWMSEHDSNVELVEDNHNY